MTLKKKRKSDLLGSAWMSNILKLLTSRIKSHLLLQWGRPLACLLHTHPQEIMPVNTEQATKPLPPTYPPPKNLMTLEKKTFLNAKKMYTNLSFINTLTNSINIKKTARKRKIRMHMWITIQRWPIEKWTVNMHSQLKKRKPELLINM